ncbi:DUF4352 domain-containing protein [Rubrobacter indicoceani]|uniref:DUF4352 domain-containing protein n=1 Tax=Rubrobacter indicoceani TaxID=2051957 RepID=UPI000E5BDBD3|nr:DUF4352 domain-containing protein [Rubrobacter indicoceani]
MYRKWIFIGCSGVLLLGFLIAGCTAFVAVLDGGSDSGGQAADGGGDEAAPQAVPVGQNLDVGEVSWVVNGAEETTSLQSQFGELGENREGSFVVVDFTFTNNGSEAVTLDTVSMALVDGQDRRFEADPDAFEFIEEGRNIFLEQVNPGVSREGTAIFTVSPDAGDFTLELGDAQMFSDRTGSVRLEF